MPRPALKPPSTLCLLVALCVAASARSAGAKPSKGPTPEEAKVAVYIDLINTESNHVLQNFESYAGRIEDKRRGPTCEEGGTQSWLSSMGPTAPARIAGYQKGLAKGPVLDGDAPARQMVAALAALQPVVEEASRYYFLGDFRNDGCKRGRALHPTLMDGFASYARADDALRAFLDRHTDARDARELASLEKQYGPGLHYHHRKLMVDAKALLREARRRPLDLAALREKQAAYAPLVARARAAVAAIRNPRNTDALYQGGYDRLLDAASQFGDQVGEFLRLLDRQATEAAVPLRRDQDAAMLAAAAADERGLASDNLVTQFNLLVQQSNQVMYSKSMR